MARIATRSELPGLPRSKQTLSPSSHRPFQEFPVASLDELVGQLEATGQGIDVITIQGIPHLVCGRPFANILVQAEAVKHVPGDLLSLYQYCEGCRIAVRVL